METTSTRTSVTRIVAVMLVAALAIGVAPAMASVLGESTRSNGATAVFTTVLTPLSTPVAATEKITGQAVEATAGFAKAERRTARAQAPLPKPVVRTASTSGAPRASAASAGGTSGGTSAAAAPKPAAAAPAAAKPAAAAPASGIDRARSILANRAARWKHVAGTTVEFGDTRGNPQAIVYYKSKRIIINPNHTVSLERIIDHEIWHIIDYHDNGQINWGESVPPKNASDFRL